MDTGIPDMMVRITHEKNRRAAGFSILLGFFFPLAALLMMHYGGQGEWTNWGIMGWMGRFVALCCVTVSAPKVYRFFLKAVNGHRAEALGATLAVEVAALMATSQIIGLYAFVLQVVINTLVYSNSISLDQKGIHKEERAEAALLTAPVEPDKVIQIKRKRVTAPKARKVTASRKKVGKV